MLNRAHPYTATDLSDSHGNTWTFWGQQGTDWTDCYYGYIGVWYLRATTDQLTDDVLSLSSNNQQFATFYARVYSGLGPYTGQSVSIFNWAGYGKYGT